MLRATASLAGFDRESYVLSLDRFKSRLGVDLSERIELDPAVPDLPEPSVTPEHGSERDMRRLADPVEPELLRVRLDRLVMVGRDHAERMRAPGTRGMLLISTGRLQRRVIMTTGGSAEATPRRRVGPGIDRPRGRRTHAARSPGYGTGSR